MKSVGARLPNHYECVLARLNGTEKCRLSIVPWREYERIKAEREHRIIAVGPLAC